MRASTGSWKLIPPPVVPGQWLNLKRTERFAELFVQHVKQSRDSGYFKKCRADIKHMLNYLLQRSLNLAPESMREEHFKGLPEFLQENGQGTYARLGTYSVLRYFFDHLREEHGLRQRNPFLHLTEDYPRPAPRAVLPWKTVRKLLSLATSKLTNGRMKSLLFKVQYSTAGRIGEITKLRLKDITFPAVSGDHVRIRLMSKNNFERTCFYPGPLEHELRSHLAERRITDPESLVFPSSKSPRSPLSKCTLIKEFKDLLRTLPGKWGHGSTHLLRRSPAQAMIDSGADIAKVSRYLSHSDLRMTTEHYARFRRVQLHKALRRALPELHLKPLAEAVRGRP